MSLNKTKKLYAHASREEATCIMNAALIARIYTLHIARLLVVVHTRVIKTLRYIEAALNCDRICIRWRSFRSR